MTFAQFDAAAFLRDHWQKTPCLIRNPWRDWQNPLDPDDLAGLACEDGVEARLVTRKRDDWKVEHGPFAEKRFAKTGKHPWTLLVQAVDQIVPDVAALIEPFRFVPNWRIDDVMVSYASDGGGVGPHFDQYDVFLIQGLGRWRWQVGPVADADAAMLPNDDLRLLADFTATDEWILEPGDILYLPPRFAHDGVALGDDCMTYSVGFRAPSRAELIAHWCDHLLAELADDDRYADPDLAPQANPGEIAPAALDRLQCVRHVGQDARLRRDTVALDHRVEHLQQPYHLRHVVGGRVDADHRVAAAVEQPIEQAGRDAGGVVGRVVGLQPRRQPTGQADGAAHDLGVLLVAVDAHKGDQVLVCAIDHLDVIATGSRVVGSVA